MRYIKNHNGRKTIVMFQPVKIELLQIKNGHTLCLFHDASDTIHMLFSPVDIERTEDLLITIKQLDISEDANLTTEGFRFYEERQKNQYNRGIKDLSNEDITYIEEAFDTKGE